MGIVQQTIHTDANFGLSKDLGWYQANDKLECLLHLINLSPKKVSLAILD